MPSFSCHSMSQITGGHWSWRSLADSKRGRVVKEGVRVYGGATRWPGNVLILWHLLMEMWGCGNWSIWATVVVNVLCFFHCSWCQAHGEKRGSHWGQVIAEQTKWACKHCPLNINRGSNFHMVTCLWETLPQRKNKLIMPSGEHVIWERMTLNLIKTTNITPTLCFHPV